MLDERSRGSLPLIVTSMDRLDIVLGLLASQVRGRGAFMWINLDFVLGLLASQ